MITLIAYILVLLVVAYVVHCTAAVEDTTSCDNCAEVTAVVEQVGEDFPQLIAIGNMTVTIYHAVPEQTDDTPMITASGLDLEGLDVEEIRVCALSRDLLKRWGGAIDYGDQIYIDLPDEELSGWWTVEDTMAARWTNHIDLLVPTSRKGGKWSRIEAWTLN